MLPSFSEWLYFIFSLFLLQIGMLIKGEKTHFGLAKAIKNSIFDSKYSEYLNKNVYMQFENPFNGNFTLKYHYRWIKKFNL